ncbi:MAG: CBM9 family sugar-binding protein [Oscillospiraceae bacterium]|nr:CBM9 family sugar-binding protein [Oscillospiraceae bacterium]
MKKAITALFIFSLAAFMILSVSAAGGTIGQFTPTVDGVKDAAYDQSVKVNLYADQGVDVGDPNIYNSGGDAANAANADAWILYDDTNMYVFVSVTDPDMVDVGAQFFADNINGWQSDSCELWFAFSDDSSTWIKFSTDGYGHAIWATVSDTGTSTDMGNSDLVPLGYKAVVVKTAAGYDAEYQLPITSYGVKQGSQLSFTYQLNNLRSDGSEVVSGLQLQGGGFDSALVLTLGAPVIIAPPETTVPDTTAAPAATDVPAAAETTAAPQVTPAAQTGDPIMLIILTAAVSAGGILFARKRAG